MRVSVNWLSEWLDDQLDASQVAEELTTAGLEVDATLPVAGALSGVVVGEILSCAPHPSADRLQICEVDAGGPPVVVVCGAANARTGLKTAFARVGATLPGGRAIEAAKIRGAASDGMLCSGPELGLGEDASGIIELPGDAPTGQALRDYLALDDYVLDIDLTPNRGDCFCVLGIARELAARRGVRLSEREAVPVAPSHDERFPVRLEAEEGCARFAGRIIRNVPTNAVSPIWLTERLRRAGLRAIQPVVDVTNYVMLELGQPLHSYDLAKLDAEVAARWGRPGETLRLLDGRDIELSEEMLVIADCSGPVGLAGIMGGASTAVDADTTDIFLEAAFFPPQAIAGRARRLGLQTDASMRFERGVDPAGQVRAIERATELLLKIAGGEPGPVSDTVLRQFLPERAEIVLRGDRLASILGQALPPQTIERCLETLEMSVEADRSNVWRVVPPSFRFDLAIEEDLIEEIARLVGYDNIPAVPEFTLSRLGQATEQRVDEGQVSNILVTRGYSEIVSYSFIEPRLAELINPGTPHEQLANPISQDLAVMRRSLWPGLLQTAIKNFSRQVEHLRLFEVGTQFLTSTDGVHERRVIAGLAAGSRAEEHWDASDADVDFYDVKGDIEALIKASGRLTDLGFARAEHPALRPGRSASIRLGSVAIGWLGELHPRVQQTIDLKESAIVFSMAIEPLLEARIPEYRSFSKFPSLRRDLAVVVSNDVSVDALLRCVDVAAGENLQNVQVFDLYRGGGIDSSRKSIGLGLILQDTSRTLTDEDADRTVATVVEHLQSELGATIRN